MYDIKRIKYYLINYSSAGANYSDEFLGRAPLCSWDSSQLTWHKSHLILQSFPPPPHQFSLCDALHTFLWCRDEPRIFLVSRIPTPSPLFWWVLSFSNIFVFISFKIKKNLISMRKKWSHKVSCQQNLSSLVSDKALFCLRKALFHLSLPNTHTLIRTVVVWYPHLQHQNRCGSWWFGLLSYVWISSAWC